MAHLAAFTAASLNSSHSRFVIFSSAMTRLCHSLVVFQSTAMHANMGHLSSRKLNPWQHCYTGDASCQVTCGLISKGLLSVPARLHMQSAHGLLIFGCSPYDVVNHGEGDKFQIDSFSIIPDRSAVSCQKAFREA